MKGKTWFAKKLDGTIIPLTELEALTHFEDNNISNRMRLEFLGTSDGEIYAAGLREAKKLPLGERKAAVQAAFDAELAKAKENGVQEPDRTLRIKTYSLTDGGANKASGSDRQKMLKSLGGMV